MMEINEPKIIVENSKIIIENSKIIVEKKMETAVNMIHKCKCTQ